jgi:hypothetical protein
MASLSSIPPTRGRAVTFDKKTLKTPLYYIVLSLYGDCSYRFLLLLLLVVHCWNLSTRVIFSSNSRLEHDSFHSEAHFHKILLLFIHFFLNIKFENNNLLTDEKRPWTKGSSGNKKYWGYFSERRRRGSTTETTSSRVIIIKHDDDDDHEVKVSFVVILTVCIQSPLFVPANTSHIHVFIFMQKNKRWRNPQVKI